MREQLQADNTSATTTTVRQQLQVLFKRLQCDNSYSKKTAAGRQQLQREQVQWKKFHSETTTLRQHLQGGQQPSDDSSSYKTPTARQRWDNGETTARRREHYRRTTKAGQQWVTSYSETATVLVREQVRGEYMTQKQRYMRIQKNRCNPFLNVCAWACCLQAHSEIRYTHFCLLLLTS